MPVKDKMRRKQRWAGKAFIWWRRSDICAKKWAWGLLQGTLIPKSLRQTWQVLANAQGELRNKDDRGIPPRRNGQAVVPSQCSNPGWRWSKHSEALQLQGGPDSATEWWGANCIPRSFWKGDRSLAPPWEPQSPFHSQNGPGLDELHTDYFLCTPIMVQKKADTLK